MTGAIVFLTLLTAPAVDAQLVHFNYPAPDPASITALRDQAYATVGATTLQMDVDRPARQPANGPCLIFFNVTAVADRANDFYRSWGSLAASKGVVAILPDPGRDSAAEDFQLLLAHVREHAAQYGIDREAIAGRADRARPVRRAQVGRDGTDRSGRYRST